MKLRARVDGNQAAFVRGLRGVGASVEPKLSRLGQGIPDVAVGFRRHNWLFELKDPSQPKNKRALTDDELRWQMEWAGQVDTVSTLGEALEVMGVPELLPIALAASMAPPVRRGRKPVIA